ncbi:Os10g0486200 [Oryza sativa Japonica Group]|uniref:Os10g0486200 protein n=1 Tax=Oryza sativa subsp. japonica TaxID=39947 RepID=A0A0N7KRZ4_ORYSJ|nr:Os10g0486200 [Oryza sativa Japonica Group]
MCWLEITGKLQPAALAPLSGDDVRRLTCLLISPVVGLQQRLVLSPVAGMQQRDAPAGAGITPLKPHQSSPTKPPALATAMDVVSSLSSSPTPAPSVLKSLLLSYAYVSVWITFSISVIMYNKYILDPTMYNWPFPISLTMVHMVFCASLAVVLVRVLRVVAEPTSPPMTPSLYAASVVPIGRALRAVALVLQLRIHLPLRLLHPDAQGAHARRRLLPRHRVPHRLLPPRLHAQHARHLRGHRRRRLRRGAVRRVRRHAAARRCHRRSHAARAHPDTAHRRDAPAGAGAGAGAGRPQRGDGPPRRREQRVAAGDEAAPGS